MEISLHRTAENNGAHKYQDISQSSLADPEATGITGPFPDCLTHSFGITWSKCPGNVHQPFCWDTRCYLIWGRKLLHRPNLISCYLSRFFSCFYTEDGIEYLMQSQIVNVLPSWKYYYVPFEEQLCNACLNEHHNRLQCSQETDKPLGLEEKDR